jgi:hypothetical protein
MWMGGVRMDTKPVYFKHVKRVLIIVASIIVLNVIVAVVLKVLGVINFNIHEYFKWFVDLITFHRQ